MKKIYFASLVLVLLSACSSTVTTTTTDNNGKKQTVEISEDAFLESERLKSNKETIQTQSALISKGQENRQRLMEKPLVRFEFSDMGCQKMPDGNCLLEFYQPTTTEMLKADAQAVTAQLANIKTIDAPTNAYDVLNTGLKVGGSLGNKLLDVVDNNAAIGGAVILGKAGFETLEGVSKVALGTPTTIDNSVNTQTTDRHDIVEQNQQNTAITKTAGGDLLDENSSKIIDESVSSNEEISGIKANDVDQSQQNPVSGDIVTEIKESVEVPVEEVVVE